MGGSRSNSELEGRVGNVENRTSQAEQQGKATPVSVSFMTGEGKEVTPRATGLTGLRKEAQNALTLMRREGLDAGLITGMSKDRFGDVKIEYTHSVGSYMGFGTRTMREYPAEDWAKIQKGITPDIGM